jgi:lipopolysaccharide export system permease protein
MGKATVGKKSPKEMTVAELGRYIAKVKNKDESRYYNALLKLHKKFSIPVACLAMGLLAVPLGIQAKNAKKAFGIGLGLFFFLLYYLLMSIGTAFGENGSFPPAVGMWMPNLILGGTGIYLLVRAAKEKPLTIHWLAPAFTAMVRMVRKK